MSEKLAFSYRPDPNSVVEVKVFETEGIAARLAGALLPRRTVEVPSAMAPHLFEPGILRIKRNQRVEVLNFGN